MKFRLKKRVSSFLDLVFSKFIKICCGCSFYKHTTFATGMISLRRCFQNSSTRFQLRCFCSDILSVFLKIVLNSNHSFEQKWSPIPSLVLVNLSSIFVCFSGFCSVQYAHFQNLPLVRYLSGELTGNRGYRKIIIPGECQMLFPSKALEIHPLGCHTFYYHHFFQNSNSQSAILHLSTSNWRHLTLRGRLVCYSSIVSQISSVFL